LPTPTLAIGVTGHRGSHPSYPQDPARLDAALTALLERLEVAAHGAAIHASGPDLKRACRLITLLADGVDHLAAKIALSREWQLTAPLPCGLALNTAINAQPHSVDDARAILSGKDPSDPAVQSRAAAINELASAANLFELAEEDDLIAPLYLTAIERPDDPAAVSAFLHEGSRRAALAGRVLIEQSDILIAVWDGAGTANQGGTGHTALLALEAGVPVIWIDPSHPESPRVLRTPEALVYSFDAGNDEDPATLVSEIDGLVTGCIGLAEPKATGPFAGLLALDQKAWRVESSMASHAYRRVETIFGHPRWRDKFASIRQRYETPAEVAAGSGKPLLDAVRALDRDNESLTGAISEQVLPRFVWAEAIAARLSNLYRSGMVINFTLGACAIIAGVLYLPLVDTSQKWIFAGIELALLLAIVINTATGQRARLHGRWLETRRAAEYLRHTPVLLALGVARPAGSWPTGLHSAWPEWYAKGVVRAIGVPAMRIDTDYLRGAARLLREHFIVPQLEYHRAKAERLHRAHHAIERFAERMFALAILMVGSYLSIFGASQFGLVDPEFVQGVAKWFTVIAVALPTISGALAAIGYFGDFDRFADISQVTAERLETLEKRVATYEKLPDQGVTYTQLSDLARLTDATAFDEIQSWQAVFSGKRTTVPA